MVTVVPQLPHVLEDKILSYRADLNRQETLIHELYKQLHRLKDVNSCCDLDVCQCSERGFRPSRIVRGYWLGFGFKDMISSWTKKIEMGCYRLRCTACTNPSYYYARRLRNGQGVLINYNPETDCRICKGTMMVWTDNFRN